MKSRGVFRTGATWIIFFKDVEEKLREGSRKCDFDRSMVYRKLLILRP